jgi:hypothetical protein
MDQSRPDRVHRYVEALYDIESGKTIVRHPNKNKEWLECTILSSTIEGRLVASASGSDECEIFSVPPTGKQEPSASPRKLNLFITFRGRICFRC